MGTVISGVRDEINQLDSTAKTQAEEQLATLVKIVETELDNFQLLVRVSGTEEKKLPIKFILVANQEVRCNVSSGSNTDNIIKAVCSQFVSGGFIKGVSAMISQAINVVVGQFFGSESKESGYMIALGDAGAVIRIDYFVFAYQLEYSAVDKSVSQALGVAYLISSVDSRVLDENTIRGLVEMCYTQATVEAKNRMAEELIRELFPFMPRPIAPAPEPENAAQPAPEKAPEESPAPAPVA